MKLIEAYNLIKESGNNYDILSDKTFDGVKNKIRVEILKFTNDIKPAVKIYSLNDPNKCGIVYYENKLSAIRAYNSLTDLIKVLEYMANYINNADSFEWFNIVKEEDIDLIKQTISTPEQPSNLGGMESSTPGGILPESPEQPTPETIYPPAPLEEIPPTETQGV